MRRSVLGIAVVLALALVASACGGGGGGGLTPDDVKDNGKLIFCSDITYPPEEFFNEQNKAVGSDIDIGKEVAQRVAGVPAEFDNTGFDGIIAALLAKKCDAIISGMNDTAERRQQVDFVDYLSVGQSLAVKPGNPENITDLESLAGHSVSVEVGTTNKDFLDATSKKLQDQGKPAIDVVAFPKDTDAANALKTGKVDAYFADSPPVAYYILQDPQSFELGGSPVNPIPVGIAIRPEDTDLESAIQGAIENMYADGTMCKILAKWKLTDFVLKGNTC